MRGTKTCRKLKVGIIGCGGIANGKHMPGLAKLDSVEITAFCDIIPEKAEKAAKDYGIQGAGIYADYRELLRQSGVEVVHICTPNKSHGEITVASLEAGMHVMCEKPMAKTSADAHRMYEAAKRTGRKLCIAYQNRYRQDALYLKKLCSEGELGEIYFAKAHALRRRAVPTWGVFLDKEQQGGGPLIDIGTHALDLTLWLMDNYKVRSVMGSTYRKLADTKNAANAWDSWDPDKFTVEDSAFGFITMQNGATIILETSWALNTLNIGEAMTTLCGTKAGADMWDGLRINGEKFGKTYINKPCLGSEGVDFYSGNTYEPGDMEAKMWIDSILNDTQTFVKPEEAMVVTDILEAVYKSAGTGKPVYFD